jgi:16S rRNA (adenine1518-N6/adenine1519-N6)-dimethyltransferase
VHALPATAAATVAAIEVDPRAVAAVGELVDLSGGRLCVVAGDAMATDVVGLVPPPRVVAANPPYNITTPLLVGWLRQAAAFERLVLMFQLEVAERICAAPGSGSYGRLSVLVRCTCAATLALRIPPAAFVPPPNVVSAVVVLTPHAVQPEPEVFARIERLIAAAFGRRRKMLRGALREVGGEALLNAAGIAADRRAETLNVAEIDRLVRVFAARGRGV